MLNNAKKLFYLSALFLLSVFVIPFFVSADNASTLQVINAGTLSFVDTPSNFSFSSLSTETTDQVSTYIPETGSSSDGDLIVQDLRFDGGFSVTMQATAFQNENSDYFNCSNLKFLTFTTGEDSVEASDNVIPDTEDVTARYDGDENTSDDYTAMTASGTPTTCQSVEVVDGGTDDAHGRIGTWKVYNAYELTVPAFAPIGTYTSTISFTLVDSTAEANNLDGTAFTMASSTPSASSNLDYLASSSTTSVSLTHSVPTYIGSEDVTLYYELCTTSEYVARSCSSMTSVSDIYGTYSSGETGITKNITEGQVQTAMASLGASDGATVYVLLRAVEASGDTPETETSTNSYSFTLNEADAMDASSFALSSSTPSSGGSIEYLDGNSSVTLSLTHSVPVYLDSETVNLYYLLCTSATYDSEDCYTIFNLNDIYGTYSSGQTGIRAQFTRDHIENGVTAMSIGDGGTAYIMLRVAEITGDNREAVNSTNVYNFVVNEASGSGDSWDPGDDSGATATSITPTSSTQTHGPHTLSSIDDYDWFSFDLTSGVQYTFTATSGSGDTYGEIYSDSGGSTMVASDDDSGGSYMFSVDYTAGATQTYYLRARCYGVGSDCGYTLSYSSSGGDSWYSVLDDTKWENYGEDWQTQWNEAENRWEPGEFSYNVELRPKTGSTWAERFRPTKMRVTLVGSDDTIHMMLRDAQASPANEILQTGLNQDVSGVEYDLDFTDRGDIVNLYIGDTGLETYVTNIEFDVDPDA